MARHILVVDDEKIIVKGLSYSLRQDDMEVDAAYDGGEAVRLAKANNYDLILLDVMLPVLGGYEVCQQIREFSDVPIIMITAMSDDMDKIMGFDYGADDYITKPFNILEVKARIKAILRRNDRSRNTAQAPASEADDVVLSAGELKCDSKSRRVYLGNEEINLTAKEFDLLEFLMINTSKVYSREQLLKSIWGADFPGDVRTVDVHVRRLREKIERNPGEPEYVMTKWGVGYYFNGEI